MVKVYHTRLGNLSTSVIVNGVSRRVQFLARDGVNGIFSTDDEMLQQAMEKSRGYGNHDGNSAIRPQYRESTSGL